MKLYVAALCALLVAASAAHAQPPTASRIYKLCLMEDPMCVPLVVAGYAQTIRTSDYPEACKMALIREPTEYVMQAWEILVRLDAAPSDGSNRVMENVVDSFRQKACAR